MGEVGLGWIGLSWVGAWGASDQRLPKEQFSDTSLRTGLSHQERLFQRKVSLHTVSTEEADIPQLEKCFRNSACLSKKVNQLGAGCRMDFASDNKCSPGP